MTNADLLKRQLDELTETGSESFSQIISAADLLQSELSGGKALSHNDKVQLLDMILDISRQYSDMLLHFANERDG